ncbi:Na+/H+ antiporter subunit G [Roseitranquillus sediminis]|uniref:Na+/H+ antiporter subunit G n=1 Tax=Roseitranquillus sediminis TaxID=2809051 RepID=UPI001D0C839A|nr:Na+/H+ antiporter subunit G [Roseitranquillus sediminis]MBM9593715.1 Na+/H+ antiporter subunit G [Roseitranquillus sediminis]
MILEVFVSLFIVVGAFFALVGSYGLIKLDNPMARLHGPTKASTLGIGSLLIASVAYSVLQDDLSLHELLITAFLFVTAPISAHFIAKAHIHQHIDDDEMPSPPRDTSWAVRRPPDPPADD